MRAGRKASEELSAYYFLMRNVAEYSKGDSNTTEEKIRVLLLVGAPGSGKGTQGRIIGMLPGFCHCSCGEVFRSVDLNTKTGKEFLEYSREGRLMPDALTIEVWRGYIKTLVDKGRIDPKKDVLVLDGIPRNLSQAQLIEPYIRVVHVFHLYCPSRGHLIERVRKRAMKEGRVDDADESVINHRLDQYESDVQSLLKFYKSEIVQKIDAIRSADIILRDVLDSIISERTCFPLENHGGAHLRMDWGR